MTTIAAVPPALAEAVAATNRDFCEALNAGDAERAARDTYTADARVLVPDGPTVVGREAIAGFWAVAIRDMGIQRVALTTRELVPLGDGAWEIGEVAIGFADGREAAAKYVVLWRHEEGRWRWHVDIWNGTPPG